MVRSTTGRKLKQFRRSRGVTQEELAHELGFAHGTALHKRETGEVPMDDEELARAIHGVTKIAKRRAQKLSPAEVLAGD